MKSNELKSPDIIKYIVENGSRKNVEGMARFGIRPSIKVYGVSLTKMRKFARKIKKNHELALKLWNTKIHEARMIAALVDDPQAVTEDQLESWVNDFETWDLCDTVCGALFDRTPFAYRKIRQWSKRKEVFVKRAAFSLLAWRAVHDKEASDEKFISFFPLLKKAAKDERPYVKKAVNWALRQIGKRNERLRKEAINLAREIAMLDTKAASWIASDALRELNSEKIIAQVRRRSKTKD